VQPLDGLLLTVPVPLQLFGLDPLPDLALRLALTGLGAGLPSSPLRWLIGGARLVGEHGRPGGGCSEGGQEDGRAFNPGHEKAPEDVSN